MRFSWRTLSGRGAFVSLGAAFLPVAIAAVPARAQDTDPEKAAVQVMRSLRSAQEVHKTKSPVPRHYGSLDDLKKDNSCAFGEGGIEPTSGYRFWSVHAVDSYTIFAIPQKEGLWAYKVVETGNISDLTRAQALAALHQARVHRRQDAALMRFIHIRLAEEKLRRQKGRYGDLNALKAIGYNLVGEGQVDPESGYRFRSQVKGLHYTITAIPPAKDLITYQLLETGEVRP